MSVTLTAQSLYNNTGHIPSTHQLKWYKAGLLKECNSITPKKIINVQQCNGTTDGAKIDSAIAQAKNHVNSTGGLAIIYFPEGDYDIYQSYTLTSPDSNIVFQGDGADKSVLKFHNIDDSPDFNCFSFNGANFESAIDITQDISKTDSIFHLYSVGTLTAGDWIHFYKYYYDYDSPNSNAVLQSVGQITQIESINGGNDTIEIKDEANMAYSYSTPDTSLLQVIAFDPIQNIGIENLKILRVDNNHASSDYYNVKFSGAVNCWLRGVESDSTSRHHVTLTRSSHIEISGCFIQLAASYAGGGNGYGIQTYFSTTNCLIENNIFRKLRHAMVAGGGSNCNVWTFNYSREQEHDDDDWPTYRDLDLHAKYPFGHLFEQNIVDAIGADSYHGQNGPYNTFFRNLTMELNTAVIERMDDWSSLGNLSYVNEVLNPLIHDWTGVTPDTWPEIFFDNPPALNFYGCLYNYYNPITHEAAYDYGFTSTCILEDISYYYSTAPGFLNGYSWPAVGPKTLSLGSLPPQSIPAEDRYDTATKTYLKNPIIKPHTLTGSMTHNQTWESNITLTGDVTVPTGITLTIASSASVNLNGHSIISTGGLIVCNTDNISPHCIRKPDSGHAYNSLGLYPTLQAALADAGSGDMIYAKYDTYTLTENLTVPDGVQFKFEDNSTINLASYYIKSQSSGYLDNFADCTINPLNIYSTEGAVRKGQFPTLQNALTNAATGRGVNFGGTRTGDFTLSKRLNIIGYNASSCIDGSLTIDNVTGGYVKLDNFHITGNLRANSCDVIWCEDMVMDKTVFMNYSAGDFINSSNTGTYSLTKIYGDCLYADNYEMAYNTYSCYGRLGSEIELYNCSLGGSWRGLALYYDSEAFLDESEFCANTSYDIYAASGCYADAMSVSQWTADPATNTFGNVDYYPSGNTYCTSLSKANAVAGSEPTLYKSTASSDGLDEYKDIAKELRKIHKEMKKELKEKEKVDKEKYKNDIKARLDELKKLVKKYPESVVCKLGQAKIKNNLLYFDLADEAESYLQSLIVDKELVDVIPFTQSQLVPVYWRRGEKQKALNKLDELTINYPDNEYVRDWLFQKGMLYKYAFKDMQQAETIFSDVIARQSDDALADWAREELNSLNKNAPQIPLEEPVQLPTEFDCSNYPNPFNPVTTVEISLPEKGDVHAAVYDIMGRQVTELLSGERDAGVYQITWNAQNTRTASGVYFCRIQYQQQTKIVKMILVR